MPFVVTRRLSDDSAVIDQASHFDYSFNVGRKLPPEMSVPVEFDVDLSIDGRELSAVFVVPTFVARKEFYEALVAAGVDNVDPYPAVIRNGDTKQEFRDYLLLNVIGVVACADLTASEYDDLGPGIHVIESVAIKGDKLPNAHIFRLGEDRMKIIVSDQVAQRVGAAGFDDVVFEPVMLT
jgi:hypothetical protein